MRVPVFSDIVAARAVVDRHLAKTPLVKSRSLSRLIGCDYYIKCENLQPVGAFKVRGGINLVATLGQYERRNGLISASTGNHGQSIAYAGQLFSTRVIIYAPAEAINPLKLQAIRDLGGEVRLRSAPAVWRAWRQGHLTPFPTVTTRHEGLATRVPFELPSFILREVLNKFVLVTDEQIDDAIYLLAEKAKLIAEGAGAASLAAALLLREELAGRKVVGILSGGNLPLEYLCNLRLKQSETEAGG